MTERPNKKAVADALEVYRDAMRPFIVRHLKRIPGQSVVALVQATLRDAQYNRFEQNIREGRSVEEAIDINYFPGLVKFYWRDTFRDVFGPNSSTRETLHAITDARNLVAHPKNQDIERAYALCCLSDIARILEEINEAEQSRIVATLRRELLPFTTSAHRFQQGGRDVYAFTLDIETLDKLLPDRVDEKVVKDANRPLTPSHAKKLQRYLNSRDDWLLGTLLLGISPEAVEFQSYVSDPDAITSVGELTISGEDAASMKMFDGQHRRRAIKDVLEELSHDRTKSRKLSSLKEASLPVMLYTENRIEALRQMFADAAQTKTIERNAVTRFDQRDAFNLAALWVAENSDLFAGRVEMERASVPRGSQNIIAINQLATTLKTTEVGYKGRVSKDRSDGYMRDLDSLFERCLVWADDFMPTARDEYNDLMVGETDNSEIPQKRTETMAYNATVLRILAGCYHEWCDRFGNWQPLAEFLRHASLKPGVVEGSLLVDAGVVAPGGMSPAGQMWKLTEAIDYIVHRARTGSD